MKLWLDDERPAPEGWIHAYSVDTAIRVVLAASKEDTEFEEASLDNDLGVFSKYGGDGYKLVDWFAEHNIWPTQRITVHTGNPVKRDEMLRTIDRYGPYSGKYGGRFREAYDL